MSALRQLLLIGLAAFLAAVPLQGASAAGQTKIGVLECNVQGGTGFIIGSQKNMACIFRPSHGGPQESYGGQITKLGLDIGTTHTQVIEWFVFATTHGYTAKALAGHYIGATGEASIGIGLGANVLVGGFDNSFVLQPFSVQAQTGLNLAIAISSLNLY